MAERCELNWNDLSFPAMLLAVLAQHREASLSDIARMVGSTPDKTRERVADLAQDGAWTLHCLEELADRGILAPADIPELFTDGWHGYPLRNELRCLLEHGFATPPL
jgi:hypothetical protein